MVVGVGMGVGLVDQLAGGFVTAVGKHDIHLGGAEAAAIDLLDVNADVGKPQTIGEAFEPPRQKRLQRRGRQAACPR